MKKKKKRAFQKKSLTLNTQGFDYPKRDFVLTIILTFIGVVGVCYFHKMKWPFVVAVLISTGFMIPFMVNAYFFYKKENKKFQNFCKYFEYMRIFYKSKKKINLALAETKMIFQDDEDMQKLLDKSIHEINNSGNYKKSLEIIFEQFPNSYLQRFHNLMIIGEEHGSENVLKGINAICFENYKEDLLLHQKKKKRARIALFCFSIIAFLISYLTIWIFAGDYFNLQDILKFQVYTFINVECIILISIFVFINLMNKEFMRSDD